MKAKKVATPFFIAALLLSTSLQASSKDEVSEKPKEQEDIITLKMDELETLSVLLDEEIRVAEQDQETAAREYFRGCSKGFKKLGAVGLGLIQGLTGSFITGVSLANETIILDLTFFGVERSDPSVDPYRDTKVFAKATNDAVTVPFNGYSDKKCAELKKEKEKIAKKSEALGEHKEIVLKDKEELKAISQVSRDAIKQGYIESLGSNKDRGVAQSR